MPFKPIKDRIVVRKAEKEISDGGIHIPEIAREKLVRAEVIAVGRGKYDKKTDTIKPLTIKKGDIIYYNSSWVGIEIRVDGEDLIVFREDNIDGIEEKSKI